MPKLNLSTLFSPDYTDVAANNKAGTCFQIASLVRSSDIDNISC